MTSVVIPWRGTKPERTQGKNYTLRQLRRLLPGVPILLTDSGHEPFSRAASRNRGVQQAAKGVVIVCDADTVPEPEPLHLAVEAARRDGKLHLPYTRYRALSPTGTAAALNGTPLSQCSTETESTGSQGGVLVMDVEAWQDAGGMDERFTGWGFEDTAFHAAAYTLHGDVVRHEGNIHHLWHPSDYAPSSAHYTSNKAHWRRYEAAIGDPTAMRRVQQSST